ncbi:sugar ABC transporter permease [Kitasatospora paracochleata]|uniref:Multiple sugar transport system permease protein n=1 Tax=Kitasatospora paracochleata TaxID=58354 RepID=A0ABT1IXY7_9ACTN|nr:sugar ABC transporter permease [Kitasatospora paracochleata]MCP2309386.1 multiple sugar transport system permease protein [Kitasatospora paracochleata]
MRSAPKSPGPHPGRGRAVRGLGHFGALAAPGLTLYVLFVLVPVSMTCYLSLTNQNPFNPPTRYVGTANYTRLAHDPDFLHSLRNTAVITAVVTVAANLGGLLVALLLDRAGRLYRALRGVFFVPVILSAVVVSVIWQALLTDDGLINSMLRTLGVDHPPGWLSDPDLALWSLAWIITWQVLGFCVVVYLAALQGVPQELHEAAALDGADALQRFRHVTWPMIAPALTINTVMLLITGFKVYDQVQVITNGGPGEGTTSTVSFDIVHTAFTDDHIGYASAMATVMLVLVALASVAALRLLQRREVTL